jgi:hypothetical protein
MDLGKVLAHLHAELANLDAAIASLQRLQQAGRDRRRPSETLPPPARITTRRTRKALAQAPGPVNKGK